MATCASCNTTILFGGKKSHGLRFCDDDCLEQGTVLSEAQSLPEDAVNRSGQEVHQGLCPVCGGSGPVDVHTSYEVWSILVMTRWKSLPRISCRACGVRRQLVGLLSSVLLGWWGFPWGLLITPVQIVKNLVGLASPPDPMRPSDELTHHVRMMIAEQRLEDEEKAESPA